jgi:hypothetical protein
VASTITSILLDVAAEPSSVNFVAASALRIEIDDHRHLEPRCMRHLRQEHRAELAGADQGDADGLAGGVALGEQVMEVHERFRFGVLRVPDAVQRSSRCSAGPGPRLSEE